MFLGCQGGIPYLIIFRLDPICLVNNTINDIIFGENKEDMDI